MSALCSHGDDMCDRCLDILSDGIQQGTDQERERILSLLQDRVCEKCEGATPKHLDCEFMSVAITVIKGQNE